MSNYMQTYTGKLFNVLDPDPESICVEDIAHSLSLMCRYGGHCKFFYSVAQHSLLCKEFAERVGYDARIQTLALLHDTAEAYVSDVIRPIKASFPAFEVIEEKVHSAILLSLGVDTPIPDEMEIVSYIDDSLLSIEMGVIMGRQFLPDTIPNHVREDVLVITSKIKERKPSDVEREFVEAVSGCTHTHHSQSALYTKMSSKKHDYLWYTEKLNVLSLAGEIEPELIIDNFVGGILTIPLRKDFENVKDFFDDLLAIPGVLDVLKKYGATFEKKKEA